MWRFSGEAYAIGIPYIASSSQHQRQMRANIWEDSREDKWIRNPVFCTPDSPYVWSYNRSFLPKACCPKGDFTFNLRSGCRSLFLLMIPDDADDDDDDPWYIELHI